MVQLKQYKVIVSERAKRNLAKITTHIAIEDAMYSRKVKADTISAFREFMIG